MEQLEPVRVAVDVLGGDEPPQVVLDGIADALSRDPALTVVAVGPASLVEPFAAAHERAEALVSEDAIDMGDDPIRAVMTKRRSSVVVGCRAVKRGQAAGFFSAGSTGALVAAGTAYITPFKVGEESGARPLRPCITSPIPNRAGGFTVFADMGGSPDVEPADLVRFAQMGVAYAETVLGVASPRVGLLSNGTEEHKGSAFTKACFPLLQAEVPGFSGNCEGGDITSGAFDVVVCDGFTGNVALKATEGAAKFLMGEIKDALMASLTGKLAALLMGRSLRAVRDRLSGDAHGGAMLLGLRGVLLIGHGATSVEAVSNGTRATAAAIRGGLVAKVAAAVPGIVS